MKRIKMKEINNKPVLIGYEAKKKAKDIKSNAHKKMSKIMEAAKKYQGSIEVYDPQFMI